MVYFNDDPGSSKRVTSPEGTALGPGEGIQAAPARAPIPSPIVSVTEGRAFVGDVTRDYTGPDAGIAQGIGSPRDTVGWVTDTGNRIQIHGTPGSETIELIHHSGAAIYIDADGAIFITPSGSKGYNLNAVKGDGVVAAKNRIVIKGDAGITVETKGSAEFNIDKNLSFAVGGDLTMTVGGSTNIYSNGPFVTETPKDKSDIVGGNQETTVAGDINIRTPSKINVNAGNDIEVKTDAVFAAYAKGKASINSVEAVGLISTGSYAYIIASKSAVVEGHDSVNIVGTNDVSLDAGKGVFVRGNDIVDISSRDGMYIDADAKLEMRTQNYYSSATAGYNIVGQSLNIDSTTFITVDAGGTIEIDGSQTLINESSPSPSSTLPVLTTDPRTVGDIPEIVAPEYPDANTIIDSMTTEREAPDFPENGKLMNGEDVSRYNNEEGLTPDAIMRSLQNSGAGNSIDNGGSYGSIDYGTTTNYDGGGNQLAAPSNPYPAPSSHLNASERLSRHVLIGDFGNLDRCPAKQMGLTRAEIVENARHLAYTCLDPIIEHFGDSVTLLPRGAGLRLGSGRSMHFLGKAHDLRATPRGNHLKTGEIAKWIAENVPFDKLFLEVNNAGTIHIHIEAPPPGQKGRGVVLTCADQYCRTRITGLNINYAVQKLRSRG
jgi:hypothetical protein